MCEDSTPTYVALDYHKVVLPWTSLYKCLVYICMYFFSIYHKVEFLKYVYVQL